MNTVKLYYPSMTQDNLPIESGLSNRIYKSLCSDICKISGGLTVYPVKGYYLSSSGILINDDISLITTFTDNLEETIKIMRQYSMIILKELNQESVLIEINNQLEFISIEK